MQMMKQCDDPNRHSTPLATLAPPRTVVWCLEGCNSTTFKPPPEAPPRELEIWLDTTPIDNGALGWVLRGKPGELHRGREGAALARGKGGRPVRCRGDDADDRDAWERHRAPLPLKLGIQAPVLLH